MGKPGGSKRVSLQMFVDELRDLHDVEAFGRAGVEYMYTYFAEL